MTQAHLPFPAPPTWEQQREQARANRRTAHRLLNWLQEIRCRRQLRLWLGNAESRGQHRADRMPA